jgi:hypothetical protein
MNTQPIYLVTPKDAPVRKATSIMWDALEHAEAEVTKLRKLLVVRLCDCRRMATTLPLEPLLHAPTCTYRKETL